MGGGRGADARPLTPSLSPSDGERVPSRAGLSLSTTRVEQANPNGILPQSPGLRAASYPGKRRPSAVNPNGVAAIERVTEAATPLGLAPFNAVHPGQPAA